MSEHTKDEFIGHPDDFAHRASACAPRMRKLVDTLTAALLDAEEEIGHPVRFLEEALTAAGLPDQASRDAARARLR